MSRVLAVDLGGSALKACVRGLDGEDFATASSPLQFDEDPIGHSEQDPRLWWSALCSTAESLAEQTGGLHDVAAVSICGFTRTQVFLDSRNNVLRPAISFRDSRALAQKESRPLATTSEGVTVP